jgi:hypothetical protein
MYGFRLLVYEARGGQRIILSLTELPPCVSSTV